MEFFDEDSQRSDTKFEVWDETGVEVEKADERMEGCAVGGTRPIADGIVFGGGWAVTVGAEVKADPFDAREEEVAFLWVEGEAPLSEDVANAGEVENEGFGAVAEEKDIVDDLAVAALDQVGGNFCIRELRKAFTEEGLPFLTHEEHEGAVAGGSVERPKRHDVEAE